jgi:predicted pyridoxine 5'-phosphate oxidase superfamily flavin-nucleotide-binding protein
MAMSTTPNDLPSPWHAGELAMQAQVGVVERMDEIGRRVLRNYLIAQHRQFYAQLPFVVLGSVDDAGDAWATVRTGKPGFLHSPDPSTLRVDLPRDAADPADAGMDDGRAIGLLGIELHPRRRNRLNGTIRRDANGFDVVARQSYGNCPQYIRLRDFRFVRDPSVLTEVPAIRLAALDDDARRMIAGADTFFVASSTERDGVRDVDVSHRGGKPGFVRVDGQGVLTIPDFAGNNFFNTLGNIVSNPRAGIVFVDFATGDLLQLTGDAEVVVDSPEIAAFQGAERLWRFRPRVVVRRPDALAVRWIDEAGGESPNSLMTGDWNDAGTRLPVRGA